MNLFWALERVRAAARRASAGHVREDVLIECLGMLEEDKRVCRAIGENGLALLEDLRRNPRAAAAAAERGPLNVLTHCNAGSLATVAYGTALAPVYLGTERGARFHVFADETRPLLQGSRITAYELQHSGIPVTVLCDSMAASLMSGGGIDAVMVGADRIAANGDVANKIGTLGLAILARHYDVPFLVAAPTSTIDLACASGRDIPIEQRDASEVTCPFGAAIAPPGVGVFNPAFDVTPAALVGAIITERGVVRAPLDVQLSQLCDNPELRGIAVALPRMT